MTLIRAYKRLKLTYKLLIVGLSLALPLVVVGWFMDLGFVYDINLGRNERAGIRYARNLYTVLDQAPEFGTVMLDPRLSKDEMSQRMAGIADQVSQGLETLSTIDPYPAASLRYIPQHEEDRIKAHKDREALLSVWNSAVLRPKEMDLHTAFLRRGAEMFDRLGYHAGLSLDPAADSNRLARALLDGLPKWRLRAFKAVMFILEHGGTPEGRALSNEEFQKLCAGHEAMLSVVVRERIMENGRAALVEDPKYYGTNPTFREEFGAALDGFQQAAEELNAAISQMTPDETGPPVHRLLHAYHQARGAGARLFSVGMEQLDTLVAQRIDGYRTWRAIGFSATALALAVSLVLFISTARNTGRAAATISEYTRRVGRGDYSAKLQGDFSSEFEDISRDVRIMVEELKTRLAFSRGILESIVAPFAVTDTDMRLTFINFAALRLMQYTGEPGEWLGHDVQEFFGAPRRMAEFMNMCLVQRICVENEEIELMGREGGRAVVSLTVSPLYNMDDVLIGASLFFFDLTELKKHEQEIQRLAAFPRENPAPVLSAGKDGEFTYMNPATTVLLDELSIDLEEFAPPNHKEIIAAVLQSGQDRERIEHKVKERVYYWIYNPVRSHELVHINVLDITRRKRLEEKLVHDAFHDFLTGLPNRALFMDRLQQRLDRSRGEQPRNGKAFAVIFMDLDRFKFVNDSLGHTAGDRLLKVLGKRMQAEMTVGNTLARLGGDEFTVLLDSVSDENDALQEARRLQNIVNQSVSIDTHELRVSAGMGVVTVHGDYDSAEDILRDADTAMYRAKAQEQGTALPFDRSMHTSALSRLRLEADLARMVEQDELVVYYQPLVCLKTGRIIGFEALARWMHPERGLVSPGEFIPSAEETGLIVPLGRQVLRKALRRGKSWAGLRPEFADMIMSVNLSVRQFSSPTLTEDIREALLDSGFAPECLKLEITESGIMENAEASLRLMSELKDMGPKLSIDDFGTGYSSLSYLSRFPFDYLKVDQSFVNVMDREDNLLIIKTIISLARGLNKKVIAEGIETPAMLQGLRSLNCDHGQGYLFSRPLPQDEAEALLLQTPVW